MKCPCCKSPLVITGQSYLETLSEHVSCSTVTLKDKYSCSDINCECNIKDVYWNEDGETYGNVSKVFKSGFLTSPYGSFERKMEVEIYKRSSKGKLKERIKLHPIFMLWFFQPYIDINYKSNEDGDVLKTFYSLGIFKRDKHSKQFYVGASFCWGTWSFLWHHFKRHIKNKDYDQAFEKAWNRAGVYVWFEKFVSIVYYKEYITTQSYKEKIQDISKSFKKFGVVS